MRVVETLDALRGAVDSWRRTGERLAFVPTMGNLHDGHLDLVREGLVRAGRVVASIFVNPLQFGPSEDYENYPQTLPDDIEKLSTAGAHLLFAPAVETVYPTGQNDHTRVEVPGLSDILCGASRPGHFVGVATVVCKLLNMVQPDVAVFGEKDFQQLTIIRRMVEDLCLRVEIRGTATAREPDGLAMSSRNRYLSVEERGRAPRLFQVLTRVADEIRSGCRDYSRLEREAIEDLRSAGFVPDYAGVRRTADLASPGAGDLELVVLAAASLGRARLIDNVRV